MKPAQSIKDASTGHGAGSRLSTATIGESEAQQTVATVWNTIEQQRSLFSPNTASPTNDRLNWAVVRVFVSSTFTDMFSERECLVRTVFPKLRAWCAERRVQIIECDLRWGVPKESTTESVIRTCLGELDRCVAENINPFFINLLGNRYGWIPTGDQVPPSVAEEYTWVPNVSITHMEILHGALRTSNPNAAFFFRSADVLKDLPDDFQSRFADSDTLSQLSLAELKQRLRTEFAGRVFDYSARFEGLEETFGMKKVKLGGLEEMGNQVFEFLQKAIEKQVRQTFMVF